jgi:peroxiredoxin
MRRPKIFETHLMKQLFTLLAICSFMMASHAQSGIPSVVLKDLNGNSIDTGKLTNDGNPILICFWATWCGPCKKELNTYADLYADWQKETGVKIYAVSIDDQRTTNSVKPYVNSVSWEYEVLLDVNKTFSQALGVTNPPHTFLLNGNGEIVWQHNGYAAGDEEEVYLELLRHVKQ